MKNCIVYLLAILLASCSSKEEEVTCKELQSSKGEPLYICCKNYGVSGDHQLTVIGKEKDKLLTFDKKVAVYGLDPFLYSFKNDTITLFFNDTINYKVQDSFKTISIRYQKVSNKTFMNLMRKAINHQEVFRTPASEIESRSINDIPKPPSSQIKG